MDYDTHGNPIDDYHNYAYLQSGDHHRGDSVRHPRHPVFGRGRRPGIKPLTLQEAAQQLRSSGQSGAALVEAARTLVGERMQYCRRNSFDLYPRAFERGYGYCQQSAYALAALLKELGFSAKVVTAFRNDFPGEGVGGHAWVRVEVDGKTHEIDPRHYDPTTGQLNLYAADQGF